MAMMLEELKNDETIQGLEKEIPGLVAKAQAFQVDSNEKLETATKVIAWAREKKKALEDRRIFFTKPLNDHIKSINAFFKAWTVPLEEAEEAVLIKVRAWRAIEAKRIAVEQEAVRKQQEEARRKAEAEAKKKKIDVDLIPVDDVPVAPVQAVKTSAGGFKKVWTYELVALSQVPRNYLALDDDQVKQAVRDGIREIPGIRIYEREDFTRR